MIIPTFFAKKKLRYATYKEKFKNVCIFYTTQTKNEISFFTARQLHRQQRRDFAPT